MSKEKQIESTDWLTRDISKKQLEREKQEAIMSADLELCHTEFQTGIGEIYTDYDTTAQKMFAKGYRKQSEGEWVARDCITESKRGRTIHYTTRQCSVCGKWNGRHKTNYCPNCGAKMKGD